MQRLRIAKTIFEKNNKFEGHKLQYFKIYYKPTVKKTVWYCPKNKQIDQ